MDEVLELVGRWWLPITPEIEVSGKLHYTPGDNPKLDLEGSLTGNESLMPPPELTYIPIICGITGDGKKVTLYKCLQIGNPISIPGYGRTSFISDFLFIGAIINKPEDIKFQSISIYFSNFNEWVHKGSIEFETPDHFNVINVEYKKPKSCSTNYKDIEFSIQHGFFPQTILQRDEIHIVPRPEIQIKPLGGEKIIEEYMKYIRPILINRDLGLID